MPNIGDMVYGFESSGIGNYLEEVRASSLEKAVEDSSDISEIRNALDATWEGQAKEAYYSNLESDIKKFKEALQNLYQAFTVEVGNASMAMNEFDRNLIK